MAKLGKYTRTRNTDTNGFYDTALWHKTAKRIRLKYHYTCQAEGCGEKGTYVHHIDPLTAEDYIYKPPEKCYGDENLTLLCWECHEIIHKRINTGIREGCYFDDNGNIQAKE